MIKAIGVEKLTEYFEFLDELREKGSTNMFGATPYLLRKYPGMAPAEARKVLGAWMDTYSDSLPAEDRADKAIGD